MHLICKNNINGNDHRSQCYVFIRFYADLKWIHHNDEMIVSNNLFFFCVSNSLLEVREYINNQPSF